MNRLLLAWIGKTDLRAPTEAAAVGLGPIAQALDTREFAEIYLLSDYASEVVKPFIEWLKVRSKAKIRVSNIKLSSPTNFGEIYEAAVRICEQAIAGRKNDSKLVFHLSPGTPAMAAVWIILAKTRFPAELIESTRERGVLTASVPFDISAEFIPDVLRARDQELTENAAAPPPEAPEFADIVHRSKAIARIITIAQRVAPRRVPVLIEGESGTGKELLARAIHRASPRKDRPFVPINCGAIPAELIESELFGHERGAFTGATQQKMGFFEAADGGTLFFDEIGELPGRAQVKLLRVLQEGELTRVGSTQARSVDVRIIAATNRNITEEITHGRFREDLFYRLAVAVVKLPPLRDRPGDVGLLIDHLLEQVNGEGRSEPGYINKKLSAGARNILITYPWPGNVRELLNTIRRIAIWSDGPTITAEDARNALLPVIDRQSGDILNRPLGDGLKLPNILKDVARHYLSRAMEDAQGNKSKAAELIGLPSYQTLTNWLAKYGL